MKNKIMLLTVENKFLDEILSFKDKMFRIAKRLLVSSEEAEDATQEVMVKLWQMPNDKLMEFRSLEAYSMTMIRNFCLDRLRSKQAARTSLDDSLMHVVKADNLNNTIEARDEMSWVVKIIDQLPEQERIIIQLRDIEQYEFDKISEIMGLPEGTVRVYLSRARKKIRTTFLNINNHGH